jgi:hypothetical protein
MIDGNRKIRCVGWSQLLSPTSVEYAHLTAKCLGWHYYPTAIKTPLKRYGATRCSDKKVCRVCKLAFLRHSDISNPHLTCTPQLYLISSPMCNTLCMQLKLWYKLLVDARLNYPARLHARNCTPVAMQMFALVLKIPF